MSKSVLIIGGSPAGLQAALDLADSGIEVHLTEVSPFIGIDQAARTPDYLLNARALEIAKHPRVSIWTATAEVTAQQRKLAKSLIGVMGKDIYVDEEKYIDMATAVSGSGPAYFFLFVESLVKAAESIGLQQDVAKELVLQTMMGSGYLMEKSDKPPAELRRMVTSPGGTTAAALHKLEEGQFTELVKQAVAAAYNRAKELGG